MAQFTTDYGLAEYIYHARAFARSANAESWPEWLAYKVFGPSLIASAAIALDPLFDYRFPRMKVTPANRTRRGVSIPAQVRKYRTLSWVEYKQTIPDLSTLYQFDRVISEHTDPSSDSTTTLTAQEFVPSISTDTTYRTRGIGSNGGEFESFVFTLPRSGTEYTLSGLTQRQWTGGSPQDFVFSTGQFRITRSGGNFRVLRSECDAFRTSESSFAANQISKHYMSLLVQADPLRKGFEGVVNVYELKDTVRMLKTQVEFFKDIWSSRGLGNQFLNYEFGWKQVVAQIRELLRQPELIAARVNYLLSRQGKATTFRAKRKFVDAPASAVPNLLFDFHFWEDNTELSTLDAVREYELRLAVNILVNFPPLEVPVLKESLLKRMWGLEPTPSTIYNMMPWTWLVDWFSDLGNYVSLIENINLDQKLVNWGYVTYQCDGVISKTARAKWNQRYLEQQNGVTLKDEWSKVPLTFPGELRWRHTVRKDLSTLGGLKTTSDLSTLTGRQLAIISALLAKYT